MFTGRSENRGWKMIRPIGEIFEFNGVKLKVVGVTHCFCDGCYYQGNDCDNLFANPYSKKTCGECASKRRPDGKNVIFKEIK
jgi:hypothetical protein